MAVGPDFHFFRSNYGLACPNDFLLIVVGLLGMFCGEEIEIGLTDRLGRVAQPKHFGQRFIDPGKAASRSLK